MSSLYYIPKTTRERGLKPYIGITSRSIKERKKDHIQTHKIRKHYKIIELHYHQDEGVIHRLEQMLIHRCYDKLSNNSICISDRKFTLYKNTTKNLWPYVLGKVNKLLMEGS